MLAKIVVEKRERLEAVKKSLPLSVIKEGITTRESLRPFQESLQQTGVSVIAEIKKASPSKGNFGLSKPVEVLARQYEKGGARAISVLTEELFFSGSSEDLRAVREAVKLPVLRKDFVIDAYQIYESSYISADAVLLIAGLLSVAQLAEYLAICRELGMSALVEAHDANEIKDALAAGAKILGINNRDLKTFKTDVNHTSKLAGLVPDDVVLVSESGISNASDVKKLAAAGADAVLVGEALVHSLDPVQKIKELTGGRVL